MFKSKRELTVAVFDNRLRDFGIPESFSIEKVFGAMRFIQEFKYPAMDGNFDIKRGMFAFGW